MALEPDERIEVFHILGLPLVQPQDFDPNLNTRLLVDNTGGWPQYTYAYENDAIVAVDSRLAQLSLFEEEAVRAILNRWKEIKYETVKVKTDKIELNYDKARRHLRQLLYKIIPIRVVGGSDKFASEELSVG